MISTRLVTSLLLSCWAFLCSQSAWAVDFKGLQLGEPMMLYAERQVFGTLDCNPMGLEPPAYAAWLAEMQSVTPGAQQICVASTSIAAVPADVTVVLGSARRVLRLTFEFAGEHYPQILRAMEAKWGAGLPEVRGEQDQSMWWEFEDGAVVSLHQHPIENAPEDAADVAAVGLAEYALPTLTPTGDL